MWNKLDGNTLSNIARNLGDGDLKSLAQVSKETRSLVDAHLSPPAKELKAAHLEIDKHDTSEARERYAKLQKSFAFARKLPSSLGALNEPRASNPAKYAYVEAFQTFCEGMPEHVLDVVTKYPHEMPVLDLGGRIGDTGKIDFLQPSDLSAPVMRGYDLYGRPFFAVRATRVGRRREEEVAQAFFQRYTDAPGTWYSSRLKKGLTHADMLSEPLAWKPVMAELLATGAVQEVYTSTFGRPSVQITTNITLGLL